MFIGNFEQDMPSLNGTLGGEALRGLSAYDIAVKNGFEGTEQEWLDSLKGKDGASKADEVSAVVPEGLPEETTPDVQSVLNALNKKPSGVQSDWSVNDPNDPAYVKNRPMYDEQFVRETLCEYGDIQFTVNPDNPSLKIADITSKILLTVTKKMIGAKIFVTIDGIEYPSELKDYMGFKSILIAGNLSIAVNGGTDTGEPFVLLFNLEPYECVVGVKSGTNPNMFGAKISNNYTVVLPERFLPNSSRTIMIDNVNQFTHAQIAEMAQKLSDGVRYVIRSGQRNMQSTVVGSIYSEDAQLFLTLISPKGEIGCTNLNTGTPLFRINLINLEKRVKALEDAAKEGNT